MEKQKVYVSYSRRSDHSFIKQLEAVADAWGVRHAVLLESAEDGDSLPKLKVGTSSEATLWEVAYDENSLQEYGSIDNFMVELSEQQDIIILLSPGYFESVFCLSELFMIYEKQSSWILPVTVFVDGYTPDQVNLEKLVADLHAKAKTCEPAARSYLERFARDLGLVLSWLLGEYNQNTQSFSTLFPHHFLADADAAVKIMDSLCRKHEPRFTFESRPLREMNIVRGIEKDHEGSRPIEGLLELKQSLCPHTNWSYKQWAESLVSSKSGNEIRDALIVIAKWQKKNLQWWKTDLNKDERKLLAGKLKDFLGYLLLLAMDDRRIYELMHRLNHDSSLAQVKLRKSFYSCFQMLVSVMSQVPAHFAYDRSSEALQGKGQITVDENGFSPENYASSITQDLRKKTFYQDIFAQTGQAEVSWHDYDMEDLTDALRYRFSVDEGHFLLFAPGIGELLCLNEVSKDAFKDLVDLTQIVLVKSENSEKVGDYYLEGLTGGMLEEHIRDIYENISELTQ